MKFIYMLEIHIKENINFNKRESAGLKHLNDSKVFIEYSKVYYFAVPKNIRLNSTHYFIIKIPNKRKFKNVTLIIHHLESHNP